eukprot:TRINITY_DN5091_c0_g1_i1.p1 TRINITY_DN5091_c0_g1~~TRINITY_DN5091_c0_g1_i1.p1  ORF type:complete len:694 (+),score=139.60 TRINITY_DN5091_c0_g1_i1:189-2270(+)
MGQLRVRPYQAVPRLMIMVQLTLIGSWVSHVSGYGHTVVVLEASKATGDDMPVVGELAGSDSAGDSDEEERASYDEFADLGELTDVDLDPGAWGRVLVPDFDQEMNDGEQALYWEGVKKMGSAFSKGEHEELQEAIRVLHSAADKGHAHAQSTLAFLYGSGTGLQQSEAKSLLYHHFAAEGGNCQSKMALAFYYYRRQIFDRAVELYSELAAIAMKSFFSMRHTPLLEPQRLNDGFEESRDALKKHRGEGDGDFQFTEFQAVKANEDRAMFKLGVLHYYGVRGVQRDHVKALKWFLQAAEKDYPPAMELAGEIYARGYGVERNYSKSLEMFTEAVRRKQLSALNGIGYLYAKGLGVGKDLNKAMEFFTKAAEVKDSSGQQDINAHYNLGVLYLHGIDGKRDEKKAIELLGYALTHKHPKAYYQFAKMYHKGLGMLEKNLENAASLYKLVADRGPWSSLMRQGLDFYPKGQKGDIGKAYLLYSRAAELGYEVAQSNAAWILDKYYHDDICLGRFGLCDSSEWHHRAHTLWQLASEQGNEHAALLIGDAYYYGKGTKRDLARAAEAYRQAEAHKNAQAMFNLGYMHEHGLGLPLDFYLAKRYYDQALEADSQAALPVTIALTGLWLRQHYGGGVVVTMIDSLPEAIPAVGAWLKSLVWGEGNVTIATLSVCLLTVLYLRQRQRRNLAAEAAPQPN